MNHLLKMPAVHALAAAAVMAANPARARLDSVDEEIVTDSASDYALSSIAMRAVSTVQQWCEEDSMGDGEGKGDRLIAMLIGIADEDKDGELSEDEQSVVQTAMNDAWDYLAAKGVAESDLEALFNGESAESNEAAERVCEFVAERMPEGDDAMADEVDNFAFGGEASEPVFDAVYKRRFAIRQGKKVRIMKRVAGVVRLSAGQKVAIRKARMKAHGSRATAKRMKSLRVRKSMGLKPGR
jgi:hypothetical protein